MSRHFGASINKKFFEIWDNVYARCIACICNLMRIRGAIMIRKAMLLTVFIILIASVAANAAPNDLLYAWEFTPSYVQANTLKAITGLDGTISGSITYKDGAFGKGMAFDGTSNRVQVYKGAPAGVALPRRQLTLEAWVKIESRGSWRSIVSYVQDNGSYERGFFLGLLDGKITGSIATVRDGSAPRLDWISWSAEFDFNRWYHVAFTYDGAKMALYIDGELVRESTQAFGDIAYPDQSTLSLGCYVDDNETGYLQGAIREVRIFDRALTQAEVKASAPGQVAAYSLPMGASPSLAPGTARVLVLMPDGTTYSGILLAVEADTITIMLADGASKRIAVSSIAALVPAQK